jgi:hypothetical protein
MDAIAALIDAEVNHRGLSATGPNSGWREWEDGSGQEWAAEWDAAGVRVVNITQARGVQNREAK